MLLKINNLVLSSLMTAACALPAMQPQPALYVFNTTNQSVTVQVTNPAANKTVSQLLNAGKGMFAYAPATIEAIMINGRVALGCANLRSSTIYPQLVTQATQQKKNLCIDIQSIYPLALSGVYLCSKSVSLERSGSQKNITATVPQPRMPRVLLINNNIFWGTITDITVSQDMNTLQKQSTLEPQEALLLTAVSTIDTYQITMKSPSPSDMKRDFFISAQLLKNAQDGGYDLLYKFTTDFSGTIYIGTTKDMFIDHALADRLIASSQQPSRFAQLGTRMIQIKNQIANRFFGTSQGATGTK